MALSSEFKRCPQCGQMWKTREDFLTDRTVDLIGYQVSFDDLLLGLLLFTHDCGTTIQIPVEKFRNLYKGPVYTERKTGGPECLGYCLRRSELRACPALCECAWVREVIQIISGGKASA